MKIGSFWRAALSSLLVMVSVPASARSVLTETFAATVIAESKVLQVADAAVQARSDGGRLRAFARRDSARAVAAIATVTAWEQADAEAATAASEAPTIDHLSPVFGLFDPARRPVRGTEPTPTESAELAELQTLGGRTFDALYVDTARAALDRRVVADKEYILNGDDQTLRVFAVYDLPKVEALAAAIRRMWATPGP